MRRLKLGEEPAFVARQLLGGKIKEREHRLAGRSTTMIAGGDDGRRQGAGKYR
jgi:hypothetical protein